MTELFEYSAHELANIVRRKEVSCREVVESHLERIEAVNDDVNAITVVLDESARQLADQLDRSGSTDQQFLGVPFTVKENIDYVGSATTNGMKANEHALPTENAPVVARTIS